MTVHVECLPDETLLKKLGFTKKQIEHHQGKSRVFAKLQKLSGQLAMVDEDPGSAQHPYELQLKLNNDLYGVKYYIDATKKNKVIVLKVKLEDWVIQTCKQSNIDLAKYGLPTKPNELHDVINNRLSAFELLLDDLIRSESKAIMHLQKSLVESKGG